MIGYDKYHLDYVWFGQMIGCVWIKFSRSIKIEFVYFF